MTKVTILILALGALAFTACSNDNDPGESTDPVGGGGADAHQACLDYLSTFNALPCAQGAMISESLACPSSVNWGACGDEVAEYFDCVANNTRCQDLGNGIQVIDAQSVTTNCGTIPGC